MIDGFTSSAHPHAPALTSNDRHLVPARRSVALLVLWTASLLGCDPSPGTGDGSEGTSTTSSESSTSSGDESSTGGAGVSTDVVGDETAGSDESGGGQPTSDMEICEALCAWETGCYDDYPLEVCMADCLENLGVFDAIEECDAAAEEVFWCQAQFESCEPTEISPECEAADQVLIECDDQFTCFAGFIVDKDLSSCTATATCDLTDPQTLEMECDTETCTCTENGEVTGECPARGVCMTIDPEDFESFEEMVDPFVEECCGWVDFGDPPIPGR